MKTLRSITEQYIPKLKLNSAKHESPLFDEEYKKSYQIAPGHKFKLHPTHENLIYKIKPKHEEQLKNPSEPPGGILYLISTQT